MGGRQVIGWFKKKLDSDKYEHTTSDIPLTTIARWYLYDIDLTKDINKLAESIGLSPVSEEGDTKEREDSKARTDAIGPLMPFLDTMSEFSALAISSMHMKEMLEEFPEERSDEIEERAEAMFTIYKAIALSTLIGTFSSAIHLNIINTDTVDSSVYFKGDLEDE